MYQCDILHFRCFLKSRNESNKSFSSDTLPVAQNEEERKKLRDVELKVMRFIDKLEQRGGNKTGLNIQKEAAKFRQQLLEVCNKHATILHVLTCIIIHLILTCGCLLQDFEASRNKHKKLKKDSRRDGSGSSDEKHRHENRKRKSSSPYYGESLVCVVTYKDSFSRFFFFTSQISF